MSSVFALLSSGAWVEHGRRHTLNGLQPWHVLAGASPHLTFISLVLQIHPCMNCTESKIMLAAPQPPVPAAFTSGARRCSWFSAHGQQVSSSEVPNNHRQFYSGSFPRLQRSWFCGSVCGGGGAGICSLTNIPTVLDVRAPGAHVEKWEQCRGAARLLGERKALCSMRAKCALALRHEKKARGHFCFLRSRINVH